MTIAMTATIAPAVVPLDVEDVSVSVSDSKVKIQTETFYEKGAPFYNRIELTIWSTY